MKHTLSAAILFSFILSMLMNACSNIDQVPVEGTWRLAHEYEVRGGTSTSIFPGASEGSELKMWAGNRWSLVGIFVEDSVLSEVYAGGTFTLEGNDYREMVEFHSAPEYLGQTVQLFLEVNGDTLTQIWPVNEEGEPDGELHYMEKWVRMEPDY